MPLHRARPRRATSAPIRALRVRARRLLISGRSCSAPLWMLLHRLWLVLVLYRRPAIGGVTVALGALGVAGAVQFAVGAADRAAGRLRGQRRCGAGRSRAAAGRMLGVVVGDDLEDAERRFFDGWVGAERGRRAPRRRAPPPAPMRAAAAEPDVIGLFPRAGARADERRHRRLRLRQSALGRQGVRARRARERPRSADRGHQRSGRGARAPTASCCRASAPSPIAGAASTPSPAWSRR